jgi:hypothetical protein
MVAARSHRPTGFAPRPARDRTVIPPRRRGPIAGLRIAESHVTVAPRTLAARIRPPGSGGGTE